MIRIDENGEHEVVYINGYGDGDGYDGYVEDVDDGCGYGYGYSDGIGYETPPEY